MAAITADRESVGTIGYFAIFVWSFAVIMLAPTDRILLSALLCVAVGLMVYPTSITQLFNLRWFILIALLAVPPIFLVGDADTPFLGFTLSSEGLLLGMKIGLRMIVVVIAVDGFTSRVDISTIAGLLERLRFRGLGFSLGVAMNLLPALRQTWLNTWRSLWIRGGLRRARLRGVQMMLTTLISNALRWAEEVALAAEARAYSPEKSRAFPLNIGRLDGWILAVLLITWVLIVFII